MVKGKLFGNKNNFRTQKVLIAAKLGNADVQLVGEHAPAGKFPLGVTPAFDGDVALFGAESIALHLAGADATKNVPEVIQWLQWAEGALLPNVLGYVLPSVSAANLDGKVVDTYKAELFAQLTHFNELLVSKTFLVGERLSVADVSVALDLLPAYQHVFDASVRKQFVNVTRWFQTIVHQAAVKEVLGDVVLASSVAKFDQAKYTELAAKVAKSLPQPKQVKENKDDGKKKKEKEQPKPKEKPAAEEPEDDGGVVEEKATDPFAAMPKGTFNMDNFKRVYSNEDTATKAIPFFWENFDAENYSIWRGEYKFPEELTLTFMSCNLINGMYQRLEKLKKNGFASVCLFGTDNNSTISGIWVWRGQDLAFTLSPDWQVDYESYTWTKLDPKDEAVKKEVNEYLLWEGDFGGKKFNQGKIFK